MHIYACAGIGVFERKTESKNEIEIVAEINGKIVGTAGIDAVGGKFKISHRADFGIAILKEYCGLGIGSALTNACIECARAAGFSQLELNVVAENKAAVSLYKKLRAAKKRIADIKEMSLKIRERREKEKSI